MIRDARIDTVGFVKELVKQIHDPQVKLIKASLDAKDGREATGDVFVAKLVGGINGSTVIDPMKWFALWKAKTITRHQLFAGMRVSVEFAQKLLSAADFGKISHQEPSAPRLCIDRIGDLPPNIQQAVAELAKYINTPATADRTAEAAKEAAPQTPAGSSSPPAAVAKRAPKAKAG